MTASATDNVGVTAVDFYVDDVLKSTSTAAPYAFLWNTTGYSNSNHTIKAVARDAAGNTGSASVTVMILNTTSSSLTAQITWQTNGQAVSRGTTVTIYATGTNAAAVTFYVDGK